MNTMIAKGSIFLATAALFLTTVSPSFASTWSQQHPARAEVLRRDNHLNRQLNNDRGHLSGRYSRLKAEDRGIRRQEQVHAAMHGGHLTRGETVQLNREENHLQHQINRNLN